MSLRALAAALLGASAALGCAPASPPGFPGYVEAEYVRVGAPLAGTLAALAVARGDQVQAGAPLFALERGNEDAARAEAESRVRRAEALVANLEKARRPPEIAATRAQLAQSQAALRQSEADLSRTEKLVADRFLPAQRLDEARAARDRDRARVAEISAQVDVALLPARGDEIAAARAELQAARDALAQAQWRVDQKSQSAPVAGLVADTLYRAGEWVPAGQPVVSLLPPGNVKLRFYVPEPSLASVPVGAAVRARCDGCAGPVSARVTFVAPGAEYTPPVIYSRENRASLVFLVEARPDPGSAALPPGLPVEVTIASTP